MGPPGRRRSLCLIRPPATQRRAGPVAARPTGDAARGRVRSGRAGVDRGLDVATVTVNASNPRQPPGRARCRPPVDRLARQALHDDVERAAQPGRPVDDPGQAAGSLVSMRNSPSWRSARSTGRRLGQRAGQPDRHAPGPGGAGQEPHVGPVVLALVIDTARRTAGRPARPAPRRAWRPAGGRRSPPRSGTARRRCCRARGRARGSTARPRAGRAPRPGGPRSTGGGGPAA